MNYDLAFMSIRSKTKDHEQGSAAGINWPSNKMAFFGKVKSKEIILERAKNSI